MKVMQFGEGNFLRSFVDLYFDTLNKENNNHFDVSIVKPIPFGSLEKFQKQKNKYHVILRGKQNGKDVEDVYHVDSVKETIDLFASNNRFFDLAEDKKVKIIISNTTEAGITFNSEDKMEMYPNVTFPAKLTIWLYKRFLKGLEGVYLLPVELIENNADELFKCVNKYILLWNLGEEFQKWNEKNNYYCNTLVDRIVSGYPKDEKTEQHLFKLINQEDHLMSIAEPFGLWVIQDKGQIKELLKEGHHNIDVVFAKDISYYKKRKVRVLNGSHTNLVPISLWMGKETVYDVMKDEKLFGFVKDTLVNDIIPYVGEDIKATTRFAEEVVERFENPFLNHQLTSIALNSISKWKARDLCSFIDAYQHQGKIPQYLTIGFAYLINMYQHIERKNNLFICHLPNRDIEVKDEEKYLTYFEKNNIHDFLSDKQIWDMDLTSFAGFEEEINKIISMINDGKNII